MLTDTLVFETELDFIYNNDLRESAIKLLDLVPKYFFNITASSTGNHHPIYANTEGGLVKHTKVAMNIAWVLLGLEQYQKKFDERQRDLILIGLLFHDSIKRGIDETNHTVFEHPLLAVSFIKDNKNVTCFTESDISFLDNIISKHMGEWNTSRYSNKTLPKPDDLASEFVHMCDYLASKKFINVEFENMEVVR